MNLYKFQAGTKDYEIGVLFSTHGEEHRIQSDEKPRSELYLHAASVVNLANSYFGLPPLKAALKEVIFSSGQQGPRFKLALRVYSSGGDEARLVFPAVSRKAIEAKGSNKLSEQAIARNNLNAAVDLLEAAIKDYVRGRRQQAVFDFQSEESRLSSLAGDLDEDRDYEVDEDDEAYEEEQSELALAQQ